LVDSNAPLIDLVLNLAGYTDAQIVFRRACEWVIKTAGISSVAVYPYDPALNQLAHPVAVGGRFADLPDETRLGTGLYGDVANSRKAQYIEVVKQAYKGIADDTKSAYVTPLIHESVLIGAIGFQTTKENDFSDQRRVWCDAATSVIAVQAAMARRIGNSQQAIARFDRFQILAQRLTENLDSKTLLQGIVDAAREMLDTQMSVLLEVREDDDELHPVAWSGITDETAALLKSRFKEDLKGLVAWARRPARTHNLLTDQRTARAAQAVVAGMLSELAVPVMYRETLYGTLAVETDEYRDFSDEEMNLLMSLAAQAGVALHNSQLFAVIQKTNKNLESALEELALAHEAQIRAYEQELETARAIQNSLLPQEDPPIKQIALAAKSNPARQVSGDFYQYYILPNNSFGLAVGDVSGKGIPAALFMAVTTTVMREEIVREPHPSDLLNELNIRLLPRMKQNNMNSALIMSVYDPVTGELEIANAGMLQPYILRGDGSCDAIEVGGYPLGASAQQTYRAKTVNLKPDTFLLFVTDGVTECQNPDGEFFGFERLEALLKTVKSSMTADQLVDTILSAIETYAAEAEQSDDITVVALKVLAVGNPA
jgi:sigma-B regulation protein RsbU (phosphoserine phosphatase)